MRRFLKSARGSGRAILALAILSLAACDGVSAADDDVTVYRIRNRWNQFIYDAGAKVGYDQGTDDANHRWVLEETPAGQRIKNLATGAYLAAAQDASDVTSIPATGGGTLDDTSLWTLDVVSGPWQSIKSCASD